MPKGPLIAVDPVTLLVEVGVPQADFEMRRRRSSR